LLAQKCLSGFTFKLVNLQIFKLLIDYLATQFNDMDKQQRFVVILILGLLSAIGPFSIDMYLPGFPAIAKDLNTTVDYVSYSLASFFVGISLGQLICGPLLDRFGRKMPLIVGLVIYIIASIGCAISTSIEMLVVFRLFQALGGCVGSVAPRAIIRDIFPLNENAKIFSLMILILGVSPLLAPTVGSYTIALYGWPLVFVILTVVTVLILVAVIFWLPESKEPDPTFSLKPAPIINSFYSVLRNPQFYTYAFTGAVASAGLFAYLSGSPFVFMNLYGVTEQQYGWIFALIASGLIISSQLNTQLLKKYSSEQIMKTILLSQAGLGIALFVGSYFDVLGLFGIIALIFLFLSCQGFSFPNSAALSMAPFSKEAGTASALMGAIQMGLGALAAALVGLLHATTALPMAGVMASCTLAGLIILFAGRSKIKFQATIDTIEEKAFEQIENY
jgi:DHA1 family bicyclomycin/chloramphenicol resistance-like MFS transporter